MRADDILESFPGFLSVMVIFQHYPLPHWSWLFTHIGNLVLGSCSPWTLSEKWEKMDWILYSHLGFLFLLCLVCFCKNGTVKTELPNEGLSCQGHLRVPRCYIVPVVIWLIWHHLCSCLQQISWFKILMLRLLEQDQRVLDSSLFLKRCDGKPLGIMIT